MVNYIRGPMVWIALLVFVFGSVYQIHRFFLLSRKTANPVLSRPQTRTVPKPSFSKRKDEMLRWLRTTVFGVYPITMTVSTVFHVCLVLLPLFLLGHNELIKLSIGVSLPSFSDRITDRLTLLVLFCSAFFLIRRMALARMRAISSFTDYLVLALAAAPFLSGFLAYHQIFDYRSMIVIHMVSGELMLMTIPFTKLAHMTFFFFNRFWVIHEHTLGRGERVW